MITIKNKKLSSLGVVAGLTLLSSFFTTSAASYSFDGRSFNTQSLSKIVRSESSGANTGASTVGFDADGNLYIADITYIPQQQTKVTINKVEQSGSLTQLYNGDVATYTYPTQFNYINFSSPSVTKNWKTSGAYKYRLYNEGFVDYAVRVDGSGSVVKADLGSCAKPQGMDVDGQGNVYVLCAWTGVATDYIVKVNFAAGGYPSVSRMPFKYTQGASYMKMLLGPVVDSQGNVYVVGGYFDGHYQLTQQKLGVERTNNLLKITPDGSVSEFAKTGDNPVAVAMDSKGYIYTVNQYDTSVTVINPQGLTYTINLEAGSLPHNLAIDKNDNVYIFGDHASMRITTTGGSSSQTPTVTSSWSPSTIASGGSSVYSYTATNASYCNVTHPNGLATWNNAPTSFSQNYTNQTTGDTTNVTCYNQAGVASSPTTATLTITGGGAPTCTNYYWFDNTTKSCKQDPFCGTYMYPGLQTFSTQSACQSAVSSSSGTVNDEDTTTVDSSCVDLSYYMSISLTRSPSATTYTRAQSTDSITQGQVTDLQTFLKDQGFMDQSTVTTGRYGSMTTKAVKALQAKYNLSQTGATGPLTRAKIKALSCN